MKPIIVKISNYRTIPFDQPIELEIKEGITFILGANNVGKSNLLKLLYEFRDYFNYYPENTEHKSRIGGGDRYFDHFANRKFPNKPVVINFSRGGDEITYTIEPNGNNQHTNSIDISYKTPFSPDKIEQKIEALDCLMKTLKKTLYIGASRNVLLQTRSKYFDINTGTAFFEEWSYWSGGSDFSRIQKINSLIKELGELFEYKNFDIKVNDDKSNLIVTTDDGIFKLSELGSGISHFVIVLANALIREPDIILIDEPETGLHPKLQQRFITALANKAKFALVATSHSIGLARSSADYILTLSKNQDGVKLNPFGSNYEPALSDIINELSYSQYAELGGSKILLVEGRTDIKAFREILRLYNIEHEFIIISFGGRQFMIKDESKIMDELNELNRFNTEVYAIFDSEKTSLDSELKEEFKSFVNVCRTLNFNVFPTDRHSTENYINQNALNQLFGNHIKAIDPYEVFDKRWPKEKNWLLFKEMSIDDFRETELHNFIINEMASK